MIPEAAVEAAVKAWDHHWGDRYGDEALEEMGEEVRVALEAAAPFITGPAVAYLDESVRKLSSGPDAKDYDLGFDDATRGMAEKVKRLLNGEAK